MYSKYQYYRNDEIGMYRVNAHKVDGRGERVGWRGGREGEGREADVWKKFVKGRVMFTTIARSEWRVNPLPLPLSPPFNRVISSKR